MVNDRGSRTTDGPMGDDSDDPLRARLAAGEASAIALLYDRFAPALYRTAYRLLGSSADAEDVVHDVFVAVAKGRARLPGIADLRAYLFASLRHAAARRGARRSPGSLPDDVIDPRKPCERDEALEHALTRLPAAQREVIALKIDGGLTFSELADVLDISPNTAASRYRYALAKLRLELEREM
jgi:RNA polymerase sigma-70 factor (ECF subfamily)